MTKEAVLYYQPEEKKQAGNTGDAAKFKSVLIRMGVRIKNVTPDQANQTVGYLAGYDGFEENTDAAKVCPVMKEEMLVMKNFTSRRIDELLAGLRRGGVPKIALKAVITDTNCKWTLYELYEELQKEHETMTKKEQP